ncbi:PQQ-binding-like beta-propeller repeat protein [Streptomyces canus]|uniref:outer membrane protein assembly factor BamB family protein n=1 Tax=Streptomyces canus TaxID=58343 RepID=UPI00369E9B79
MYLGSNGWYPWAVDAATGKERWKQETGAPHQSSPTVAEGTVYIGSEDMSLRAVNAATSEERWRLHTRGKVNSSPVVADGTVYVSSQDNFPYAVHTGRPRPENPRAPRGGVDRGKPRLGEAMATCRLPQASASPDGEQSAGRGRYGSRALSDRRHARRLAQIHSHPTVLNIRTNSCWISRSAISRVSTRRRTAPRTRQGVREEETHAASPSRRPDRLRDQAPPARRLGVDTIGPCRFHRPIPPSLWVPYESCSTRVSS